MWSTYETTYPTGDAINEAGVRDLKVRASEILRDVRDRHARYVITYRGRPVAMLVPLEAVPIEEQTLSADSGRAVWAELERLGKQIGVGWRSPLTSTELLSAMRR